MKAVIVLIMKSNKYFRAGVGTVIYNEKDEVLLFERNQHPIGIWQFQQGGIDVGEDAETTLWRELLEETGFTKEDIDTVTPYPKLIAYKDLNPYDSGRLGQVHNWYFLKLKPDTVVDLAKAHDDEFSAYRWVSWAEAIDITSEHKKHVYIELHEYFKEMKYKNGG